jgi:hypothetical protein
MAILERMIQKVVNNHWDAVTAQEKEWEALETKVGGFPKKRRYRGYAGAYGPDTFVFEREWESMATYEAAYRRLFALPEVQALGKISDTLKIDTHVEFYGVLE